MPRVLTFVKAFILAFFLVVGLSYLHAAWSNPTASPPNNNTPEPINVGASAQSKSGWLGVNTGSAPLTPLEVVGNISADQLTIYGPSASYIGGNLGVGVTNPSQKIDANGYVKGTGLCIGSTCLTTWDTLDAVSDRGRETDQTLKFPKFEDRDNTAYYIDPASSGTSAALGGKVNAAQYCNGAGTECIVATQFTGCGAQTVTYEASNLSLPVSTHAQVRVFSFLPSCQQGVTSQGRVMYQCLDGAWSDGMLIGSGSCFTGN